MKAIFPRALGTRLNGLLALLVFAGPVLGQLDPGLKKPYHLQVVLQMGGNRVLTPIFQDQVQRELGDHLRLALGKLAQVEVVRTHPLLRAIEERGLANALESWDTLEDFQTHFVLVDFAAGLYEIQTRAHDGQTGITDPRINRAFTPDRGQVARIAARLLESAFSPVGTVETVDKEVKLALRGGELGPGLERFLRQGEVLAISKITQEGGRPKGRQLEWALLEVVGTPQQGYCRCRFWRRYQEDNLKPGPGVLGFRCLKLNTTQGPLRLRIIDDNTLQPLEGLQVHVLQPGQARKAEMTTNHQGWAHSRESFAHLALVRILSGETVRAQFPVALTDDQGVVCRLKAAPEAEGLASWEMRKDQWLGRLYDQQRLAVEQINVLNLLLARSIPETLDQARVDLKNLDDELANLTLEKDQIIRLAQDKKIPPARLDWREGDQRLAELQEGRKKLTHFIDRLETILRDARGEESQGLAQMLERARLLESQAQFEQALQVYARVLHLSPDQPKVQAHVDQLKKAWVVKDDIHQQARVYIYQTWPGLEVSELKANLATVRTAFAACKEAGDHLTPRKLALANIVHAGNLKKRLDTLRTQNNEDSRIQAQIIAQVADGLRNLHGEVTEYLKKQKDR